MPFLVFVLAMHGLWPLASAGQQPTIFDRLSGTWDWEGVPDSCSDNPHSISFSDDRKTMILTYRRPPNLAAGLKANPERPLEVRYEVREQHRDYLRVVMIDPPETRRMKDGRVAIWDLVLSSKDKFYWRLIDWEPLGRTRNVVRCRDPK